MDHDKQTAEHEDMDRARDRHARAVDLMTLLEQAVAGTTLIEEFLDDDQPGWDAPRKTRGRAGGPGGAPQYVRAALHTVWINVAHILVKGYEVEPWRVPPLAGRGDGKMTVWQVGPDGSFTTSDVESWDPAPTTTDPVRPVWKPTERLYTLEEARSILEACGQHDWVVEVDDDGSPVAVGCARKTCEARRPVA